MNLNEIKIKVRVNDLIIDEPGARFDGIVEMIASYRGPHDASNHCESCDNSVALVFVPVTPNVPMEDLVLCVNCLVLGDDLITIEGAWNR